MARTLEEIDADIAKFQAAEDDMLLNKRTQSVKHGDREMRYDSNFESARSSIRKRLFELRHERAKLTGERSPAAPIFPPIMS